MHAARNLRGASRVASVASRDAVRSARLSSRSSAAGSSSRSEESGRSYSEATARSKPNGGVGAAAAVAHAARLRRQRGPRRTHRSWRWAAIEPRPPSRATAGVPGFGSDDRCDAPSTYKTRLRGVSMVVNDSSALISDWRRISRARTTSLGSASIIETR